MIPLPIYALPDFKPLDITLGETLVYATTVNRGGHVETRAHLTLGFTVGGLGEFVERVGCDGWGEVVGEGGGQGGTEAGRGP